MRDLNLVRRWLPDGTENAINKESLKRSYAQLVNSQLADVEALICREQTTLLFKQRMNQCD